MRTSPVTLALLAIAIVLHAATPATAQQPTPPAAIEASEAVKHLPWRSIDLSAVAPLEYDRALLVMNQILDAVTPVRASEADLMSSYIEQQGLGNELAKAGPQAALPEMSFDDGLKVAVAMLRGPSSASTFAQAFSDADSGALAGYKQMYSRTCQRRWAELLEATQQANCMRSFLVQKNKLSDYQAWAKVESENRELKYELEQARKVNERQAAQAQQLAAEEKGKAQGAQLEQQQMQHAMAMAMQQQQQPAQQQAAQGQSAPAGVVVENGYVNPWYVPTYYGAGAAWCHDAAYAGAARAATDARMSNWHGVPHAGRYR